MTNSIIATGGLSDPWGDPSYPGDWPISFLLLLPAPKGERMTNEDAARALAWVNRVRSMVGHKRTPA